MKNIGTIFRRDLKSSFRDSMILYILAMPFLIALLLNLLTDSTTGSTLKVIVDPTVDQATVEKFQSLGEVERAVDLADLTQRVERLDDVYGLRLENGLPLIYQQGNEKVPMAELIGLALDTLAHEELLSNVEVRVSDVGWKLSPVKQYGGSLLSVFVTIFGSMVLMIHLVEEKQENTLAAMNVAPVRRMEYVAGKSILGFLLPVIHVLGVLLILDYGAINLWMATVIILALALTSVTVGFAIGVKTDNIIGAISAMKMMFLPILGSVFGAIYLREGLQFLLYWSPFYWAFRALDQIILQSARWIDILISAGMILAISALVLALLQKNIRRGLN